MKRANLFNFANEGLPRSPNLHSVGFDSKIIKAFSSDIKRVSSSKFKAQASEKNKHIFQQVTMLIEGSLTKKAAFQLDLTSFS